MITTINFDMNGVIIDDEAIHEQAFRLVCKDYKINLTSKEYQDWCLGRTNGDGFKEIVKKYNLKGVEIKDLMSKKSEKYKNLIKDRIKAFPGVIDLIQKLSNHFVLALTSSSYKQEVEMILSHFGIKKFFKVIVTGDNIIKGKPNPEPYLLTAKRLKVEPKNCLVIEDAKSGVLSAKRAGMKCIAITTTHTKQELIKADNIVDEFSQINEDMIRKL